MTSIARRIAPPIAAIVLTPALFAQQFTIQPNLPASGLWTEGVECADVDHDGDLDIFFACGDGFASAGTKRQNILIINKLIETGPGVFADESVLRLGAHTSNAKQVTTGDVNGDGWVDALYANAFNTSPPSLYINQGFTGPASAGFFNLESATRGFTTSYSSGGACFADLDDDGDLDVVIGDAYQGSPAGKPHLFFNDGNGNFTENAVKLNAPVKASEQDVQFADVDNNWTLDLFICTKGNNTNGEHYLMLNDGTGSFTDVSPMITSNSGATYEAEIGDLDNDGDVDFFMQSLVGLSEGVIKNNLVETGTFSLTNLSPLPGSVDDNEITLFDFDCDGFYDEITGSLGTHEYLWHNNGGLAFSDVSAGNISFVNDSTLDMAIADLDNDGRYDIITAQGESGAFANKWYKNSGPKDTRPPVIVSTKGPSTAPVGTVVAHGKIRDQVLDDGVNYVTGFAHYVVNRTPQDASASILPGAFSPAIITVQAGTTITWTNSSGVNQTVDLNSAPYNATSGPIANLGTYAYTFVNPGTYNFSSTTGLTGQVIVTGGAATQNATYSGGQIYRFAMQAPSGAELCYELVFKDWPGNVSVTRSVRVGLTGGSCTPPTTYCTAKVNSNGCTPAIAWNGTPSATAGAGFFITATNELNNKSGLFFYSYNGQQAAAFQGGTLCAKLPLKRTALQGSGGNAPPNDCSGTYKLDFNAYIASGVDAGLVSGAVIDGQYWARDPGFSAPNNTSLTDAIHVTICP